VARPETPHKLDEAHFTPHDPELLQQGDILGPVKIAYLSVELEWLTEGENGYIRTDTDPPNGAGLLLAEGRLLPVIVLSFTCDVYKVLRDFIASQGLYSPSFVVHAVPILPMPTNPNEAGIIRAGRQYSALYLPPHGSRPASYADFSLYQPLAIRTALRAAPHTLSGLTELGRIRLATAFAQFLGDDSRRKATNPVPNAEERTFLAQATALL